MSSSFHLGSWEHFESPLLGFSSWLKDKLNDLPHKQRETKIWRADRYGNFF